MTSRRRAGTAARDDGTVEADEGWMAAMGGLIALVALLVLYLFGGFDLEPSAPPTESRLDWKPAYASVRRSEDSPTSARPVAEGSIVRGLRLHGVVRSDLHGANLALVSSEDGVSRAVAVGEAVLPGLVVHWIEADRVAVGPPGGGVSTVLSLWSAGDGASPGDRAAALPLDVQASVFEADAALAHRDQFMVPASPVQGSAAPEAHVEVGEGSVLRSAGTGGTSVAAHGRRNRLRGVVPSPYQPAGS